MAQLGSLIDGQWIVAVRVWGSHCLLVFRSAPTIRRLRSTPLGAKAEFDPLDLDAKDANGDLVIAGNEHVRIAHEMAMAGSKILRRSCSNNDGANITA